MTNSNYTKISSITIARDEEKNILRCIKSLEGAVDEIIVLIDSRTTDKTSALLSNSGSVTHKIVEWAGFSETKKQALAMTSNDWVFWIDADEELTPELREEIIKLKNDNISGFASYSIPRRANFLGRWIYNSGWYPGRVTRIFNKTAVDISSNSVHEHLMTSGASGQLVSDLNHYTDPNIDHYFRKFNNYTSLASAELIAKNKKFRITDIIIRPIFMFIKMYILKQGFLDGLQGFILAVYSSLYVFTKYAKLWEQHFMKENHDT